MPEFVKLKSALDQYEYNLGQLVCNVDAFHVKKKEMLKSARKLDVSVQMIKEKVAGTGKYSGGRGGMDDFIELAHDASKGYSTRNGCSLITGKIDMNCSVRGENIYQFSLTLSRHSGYPSVVMGQNQYSFIINQPLAWLQTRIRHC